MSMPITDAKSRNNKKWDAENLARISVMLPKEIVADFKSICDYQGTSYNGTIRKLVEKFIEENK